MSEERLNELKVKINNPESEEDLRAVLCTIFDRFQANEISDEEMCMILQKLRLPDEVKESMKMEEVEVLKK